jgi:hypothetical protein
MWVAAVSLALSLSCTAAQSPCGAGRTCGDARWAGPSPFATRGDVWHLTAASPEGEAPRVDGALWAGARPLVLHFEPAVRPRDASQVERALLALAPAPGAPAPTRAVRVTVRGAQHGQPTPEPEGSVVLPGGVRAGLRVDVTGAVRAALRNGEAITLHLETDGPTIAFAGLEAPPEDLGRLEILSP